MKQGPKRQQMGRKCASSSAASMSMRVGYAETDKVRVEGGKLIYWTELLRSIDEAAAKLPYIRIGIRT